MKSTLLTKSTIWLMLFAVCFMPAKAIYTPVTLTGFNADVVANGIGLPTTSTTQPFDAATANPKYILIAQNYQLNAASPLPTYFLPNTGTLNSLNTTGLTYQLASYSGNNSLRLTGTTAPTNTGTLTFPTPNNLIGDVYVLGSTGSGSATVTITINFTQGGTQTATATFNDWFNSTVVAVQGIGRADQTSGVIDAGAGSTNPRLYEVKIPLDIANYAKTIQSVTITRTGGSSTTSVLNIMGITVDHQTCLPTPAVNVTAGSITTTGASFTWTSVTGSQGYEYAITTSATPPASGTLQGGTSYSINNLFPGTTYYMHVRNKCGTNSFSMWNKVSFTTLACPTAGAPVISNNAPGTVTFSWPGTSIAGVTNYQWAVTTSSTLPAAWNTTSNLTATDNTLVPGTTYYIHVRSNCTNTQSTYTAVQFANPFPPCGTPTGITISGVNMHGAEINWNASPNVVQGYQYAINTNATPPANGTLTTSTSLDATKLVGGTKYYVHLRTLCGANVNNVVNYSSWVKDSFTTPGTCLPPVSTSITNVSSTTADIQWTRYPGIYGYEYVLNSNPLAPPANVAGAAINYNTLNAVNLYSGTNYYFHIRIRCDTFTYSPWTTSSFTTTNVCGVAPSTPVLTGLTSTTATFNWSAIPGALQYQYSVTTTNAPDVNSNTYTSQNHATAINLTPNNPYYFHVRAYCSPDDLSGWATTSFSTAAVSVNAIGSGNEDNILLYPNPVGTVLNIKVNRTTKSDGKAMLYDLSGKFLKEVNLTKETTQIDMSGLTPGLYLLKYRDEERSGVIRVQKQ